MNARAPRVIPTPSPICVGLERPGPDGGGRDVCVGAGLEREENEEDETGNRDCRDEGDNFEGDTVEGENVKGDNTVSQCSDARRTGATVLGSEVRARTETPGPFKSAVLTDVITSIATTPSGSVTAIVAPTGSGTRVTSVIVVGPAPGFTVCTLTSVVMVAPIGSG
ncbi:MAG: hypothetical protein Q9187_009453 [Circinaria calcarea]